MTSEIEFSPLSELYLDPFNPRLGRAAIRQNLSQEQVYDRMRDWSLEELAASFLESGFWPHEAVLCVEETIIDVEGLVVIEGNRRVAALKRLQKTFDGDEPSRKWKEMIEDRARSKSLFEKVPFIRIQERGEVDSYIGFRHVTGIKEWAPPEKAQFIAKLIDERGNSYHEVMRKIGSKTQVVERNYIAYAILEQMESTEGLEFEEVEKRFSVLFLALREKSIQRFLGIEGKFGIDPKEVKPPVSDDRIKELGEFSRWLFGDSEHSPVVTDSRNVGHFARVLDSSEAVNYFRSVKQPSLEKAFVISGGDKEEFYSLISTAAYSIEEALSSIHHYKDDENLKKIYNRLLANFNELKSRIEI